MIYYPLHTIPEPITETPSSEVSWADTSQNLTLIPSLTTYWTPRHSNAHSGPTSLPRLSTLRLQTSPKHSSTQSIESP